MPSDNFIIQDLVHHIHDESYYKKKSRLITTLSKTLRDVRIYIGIILLSLGLGYIAAVLSDQLTPESGMVDRSGIDDLKSKFEVLPEDQKQKLIKKYGAGQIE